MWVSESWADYELLDCSGGERLERWGGYVLVRPDPQVIWHTPKTHPGWEAPHARYLRSKSGGGRWTAGIGHSAEDCAHPASDKQRRETGSAGKLGVTGGLPDRWRVGYRDLTFNVSLMNFKHTGLFPEQAVNWDFITEKIRSAGRRISVLNLFAYTGGATLAAAAAGASVCHVDAARGMVQRARENAALSGLGEMPVRWIVDDCAGFVEREIKRGRRYDAIIMDPPSYGRGPGGETWKLEDSLYSFAKLCAGALSDDPLFVLINSYTAGLPPSVLAYIAKSLLGGEADCGELGLPVTSSGMALPCGATCRWTAI